MDFFKIKLMINIWFLLIKFKSLFKIFVNDNRLLKFIFILNQILTANYILIKYKDFAFLNK